MEDATVTISRETIAYLAHLARLDIENTRDSDSLQDDLNGIVKMVDQISAANTEGFSCMEHPLQAEQPLRSDTVTESNQRDHLLALSAETEGGLFLVPAVIE